MSPILDHLMPQYDQPALVGHLPWISPFDRFKGGGARLVLANGRAQVQQGLFPEPEQSRKVLVVLATGA